MKDRELVAKHKLGRKTKILLGVICIWAAYIAWPIPETSKADQLYGTILEPFLDIEQIESKYQALFLNTFRFYGERYWNYTNSDDPFITVQILMQKSEIYHLSEWMFDPTSFYTGEVEYKSQLFTIQICHDPFFLPSEYTIYKPIFLISYKTENGFFEIEIYYGGDGWDQYCYRKGESLRQQDLDYICRFINEAMLPDEI